MYKDGKKVVKMGQPVTISFQDQKPLVIFIYKENTSSPNIKCLRIRFDAPVAEAILGKEEGSLIQYQAAGKNNQVKILKILT